MRSASDDLTARARIRDTAIAAFARDGFDRTSLRGIAREARVSPALVVHHFGDKDGLRAACDQHVVQLVLVENQGLSTSAAPDLLRAALDELGSHAVYVDYLSRMLVDDSASADTLFDTLLQATRDSLKEQADAGMLRPSADPEAAAVLLTLYGLGPVILRRHFARAFGGDRLTVAMMERATLPVLEVFTHGMFADDRLLVAAKEALARSQGPHSDRGTQHPTQDPAPPADPASADTPDPGKEQAP